MLILLFLIVTVLFSTCEEPTKPEEDISFVIYITDEASQAGTPLNSLTLLKKTFLCVSDINTYEWSNHHITYPECVYERLKTWGNLLHRIFVVSVENERIYWGKFMDDLDPGGCQNPVIRLIPRHQDGRNIIPPEIRIECAYPEYFGSEEDPDSRFDSRIYDTLEKTGILIP